MQDSCLYFSSSGLQWNVCQKSESLSFFHVLNNRCQVCWLNLVKNKIKLTIQTTVCTCFPVHILVGCNWLSFQSYGSNPTGTQNFVLFSLWALCLINVSYDVSNCKYYSPDLFTDCSSCDNEIIYMHAYMMPGVNYKFPRNLVGPWQGTKSPYM